MEKIVGKDADFKEIKIYFYDKKSLLHEVFALYRMWRFYRKMGIESTREYWFEKNRLNEMKYNCMWRNAFRFWKNFKE